MHSVHRKLTLFWVVFALLAMPMRMKMFRELGHLPSGIYRVLLLMELVKWMDLIALKALSKDLLRKILVQEFQWHCCMAYTFHGCNNSLGSILFFFVELKPQYVGACNGILAAGVMLAASFDLIEGQSYGRGNWAVIGILAGELYLAL